MTAEGSPRDPRITIGSQWRHRTMGSVSTVVGWHVTARGILLIHKRTRHSSNGWDYIVRSLHPSVDLLAPHPTAGPIHARGLGHAS